MMRKVYTDAATFFEQNAALSTELPFSKDVSILKTPLAVGDVTVPNRLVCQAMEGCDATPGGTPGELTQRRYARMAAGGAGLIWFEATAVLPNGRANPRQLYLCEDTLDAFKRQVEAIKETGLRQNGYAPVVILQATHSGRYSKPHGYPEPLVAYRDPASPPNGEAAAAHLLTDEELDRVGEALVHGAVLAQAAGFDGVDIKACHGYLNSELLSAYTRRGRYGGSFENRTRLLRESVQGAREATDGRFLVTSRLNVYDGVPYPHGFGVSADGGAEWDPTEPIRLVRQLAADGVRLLNISMGNPYVRPHINRPFAAGPYTPDEHPLTGAARMLHGAAALKAAVPNMRLVSSGWTFLGVAAPHVAAAFLKNDGFDLAGFGRTAFAYPDFARDILQTGGMKKEKVCLACSACTALMRAGSVTGCVVRDRAVYGPLFRQAVQEKKARG